MVVTLDPRVHVSPGDLEAQRDLARMIDDWMNISYRSYDEVGALRAALGAIRKNASLETLGKEMSDSLQNLDKELGEIQEGTNTAPGFGAVNRDVARFVTMIQSGDIRPAKSVIENAAPSCTALKNDLVRWRKVNTETLPLLNKTLMQGKLAALPIVKVVNDPMCGN